MPKSQNSRCSMPIYGDWCPYGSGNIYMRSTLGHSPVRGVCKDPDSSGNISWFDWPKTHVRILCSLLWYAGRIQHHSKPRLKNRIGKMTMLYTTLCLGTWILCHPCLSHQNVFMLSLSHTINLKIQNNFNEVDIVGLLYIHSRYQPNRRKAVSLRLKTCKLFSSLTP